MPSFRTASTSSAAVSAAAATSIFAPRDGRDEARLGERAAAEIDRLDHGGQA